MRTLFLAFLLFALSSGVVAASPIAVDQVTAPLPLRPYLSWVPAQEGSYTIDDVSSASFAQRFSSLGKGFPLRATGPVWLRLSLVKNVPNGVSPPVHPLSGTVLQLRGLPPGYTRLFTPATGPVGAPGVWIRDELYQGEPVTLPEPGLTPTSIYIRTDETPGLWFAPVLEPKSASRPALLPPEQLLPGLLLLSVIACLLRSLKERTLWPAWVALFLLCAMAQTLLPLPSPGSAFTLKDLPALLAPGLALMILPHIGRTLLGTQGVHPMRDAILCLYSLVGAALCLAPLVPGYGWLTRLYPVWPLLLTPLLPLCLAAPGGNRSGSFPFTAACLMSVAGAAVALFFVNAEQMHPLVPFAALWGLAIGGIGLALARAPRVENAAPLDIDAPAQHPAGDTPPDSDPVVPLSAPEHVAVFPPAATLDFQALPSLDLPPDQSAASLNLPDTALFVPAEPATDEANTALLPGMDASPEYPAEAEEPVELHLAQRMPFPEEQTAPEANVAAHSAEVGTDSPLPPPFRPDAPIPHGAGDAGPTEPFVVPTNPVATSPSPALNGNFGESAHHPSSASLLEAAAALGVSTVSGVPGPASAAAPDDAQGAELPAPQGEGATTTDSEKHAGIPDGFTVAEPRIISLEDDDFSSYFGNSPETGIGATLSRASFIFSLHALVREVHDIIAPPAELKGLFFSWFIAPSLPPLLEGDSPSLRQALFLLLQNAVQTTKHGAVRLSVHAAPGLPARPGQCALLFTVSDSGAAERTDAGFFHAWELAARTGGAFIVDYSPAGGTQISFSTIFSLPTEEATASFHDAADAFTFLDDEMRESLFPISNEILARSATSRQQEEPPAGKDAPPAPLVMVVDMTTSNRRLLSNYLSDVTPEPVVAASAGEAVTLFQQTPVPLIIFDADMPEPDIINAVVSIQAHAARRALHPASILALTGHEAQSGRMLAAGCTHVLCKPFSREELETVVRKALQDACVVLPGTGDAGEQEEAAEITAHTPGKHLPASAGGNAAKPVAASSEGRGAEAGNSEDGGSAAMRQDEEPSPGETMSAFSAVPDWAFEAEPQSEAQSAPAVQAALPEPERAPRVSQPVSASPLKSPGDVMKQQSGISQAPASAPKPQPPELARKATPKLSLSLAGTPRAERPAGQTAEHPVGHTTEQASTKKAPTQTLGVQSVESLSVPASAPAEQAPSAAPMVLGLSAEDVTAPGNEPAESSFVDTAAAPAAPQEEAAGTPPEPQDSSFSFTAQDDQKIPPYSAGSAGDTPPMEQHMPLAGIDGESIEPVMLPLLPGLMYSLREAIADAARGVEGRDPLAVQSAAERLSAQAENFGLRKLGKVGRCVERAAAADDLDAVATLMEDMNTVAARYLHALQECYRSFIHQDRRA